MKVTLRRIIALLMILALSVSFMPAAYAAETDGTTPEDQATSPPETVPPAEAVTEPPVTDSPATEEPTVPDSTDPEETTPAIPDMAMKSTGGDGIATVADAEIVGNPTTFATLFLLETIQIPSFGHMQSKEHIPLYSVYLKNQPGYETNYYIAYCIEPGIVQDSEVNYGGNSSTLGALGSDSTVFTYLTPAQLRAMGVALLYGQMEIARKADAENIRLEKLRRWASTQLIIWEIAAGWRSTTPPYICNNDTLYDAVTPTLETKSKVWGTTFNLSNITSAYDDIEAKMAKHYTIPSFSSDQKSMAPTHTMTANGSGGYTITLTDTNNILSEYTFTDTDNIKYSVSGNKLTVTVTGNVTGDIVCSPTKNIPNLETQLFWVWESGENQRMMSLKTEPLDDPVPCYFKLKVNSGASLNLVKTTEDGKNLAGWKFNIYSDVACTKLVSGPHTTDSKGKISVSGLTAGTVYVKELGHTDSAVEALYTCTSTNPQKVTLTSGQTSTVTFNNDLVPGYGKIIKKTTNGGTVAGWHFEVKDASGKVIGTYVTDSTGVIQFEAEPGTYTVTETDGPQKYWVNDATPSKTVTVKAGQTASVTFTNQWRGQAQIIKTATNGGTVAGWHFEVKDASGKVIGTYETDASGLITLDLDPGTYTVTETDGASRYWEPDSKPSKTVTVKAGQTAKVTFQNQYKGEAQIIKTTTNGGTVAGWHFDVKDSGGNLVGSYVTDSTGIITVKLDPGTYTVTETDAESEYWEKDPNPTKTVMVKAGETAKVTYVNKFQSVAQIIKKATNGGTVAGWHFTVKDSSGKVVGEYVTDHTGIIVTNLDPGTYTVTETDAQAKYWVNDPTATKTLTVKAGETASVTFTNQWRGQCKIVKKATNGGSVAGWHFEVKDSKGKVVGTYETDASGVIVADLEPGTYTVRETDGSRDYWELDAGPKTVTVKAGQTAEITFQNKWSGKAKIIKTATNGGKVDGWSFTIKNSTGTFVGNYTTNADGIIVANLDPGTYTVQENAVNDPYWVCDTSVKTITVKAGETASVSFQNRYIGKAKIVKTLENPGIGTVEGWNFEVKASDGTVIGKYTTDADGTILLDLKPGTYTVTELLEEGSIWKCVTDITQKVTVKAGQTAEVSFVNALNPAEILVYKVDPMGAPLSDAEFLLEWSEDGTNWQPVTYTDISNPKVGGCSSEGLTDGKLVSGRDGVVHFTGLYPSLQYRLTEVKAPNGYLLLTEPAFEGEIPITETLIVELTVVNAPVFELPMTGSTGSTVIRILQIVGVILLLALLLCSVKKLAD